MRITAANGPLTDVYPVIPWYLTAQWSTGAQGTFPPMVHWRKMLDRVPFASHVYINVTAVHVYISYSRARITNTYFHIWFTATDSYCNCHRLLCIEYHCGMDNICNLIEQFEKKFFETPWKIEDIFFVSALFKAHNYIRLWPVDRIAAIPSWEELGSESTDIHVLAANNRSMDLGDLLENCSWYDKWQFSADLYKKTHCFRPKQLKSWVTCNSHTVPRHACANFR